MIFIPILNKIIKILKSQGTPTQVAAGFVLGMFMAFMPLWNLLHLLIIFVLILFSVNIGSFLLAFSLFKTIAFILDPWLHLLGYLLLVDWQGIHPFWVWLYKLPLFPYMEFNNTVTLGGLILSIVLAFPVYKAMVWVVVNYRTKIDPKIEKLKIVKLIKSGKLYSIYASAKKWRGS